MWSTPRNEVFSKTEEYMTQALIKQKIKHGSVLGVTYVLLCLLIGEEHPFSRVDMYNSFPLTSQAFYISDTRGKLIPLQKHFKYSSGNLAHNYYAIQDRLSGTTPDSVLCHKIAVLLYRQLKQYQISSFEQDTVQLRRMTFSYSQNELLQTSEVIYETTDKGQ